MLKKIRISAVLLALLLTGCGAEETMETVADEILQSVTAEMHQIYLELPAQAASPAVESDADRLYQCDTYDIRVQTLAGGDLNRTVRSLSGYDRESLTILKTVRDGWECYEFVWASAGECGVQVGRAMVICDGSYHYCVSVLGDADCMQENRLPWDDMFASFRLA